MTDCYTRYFSVYDFYRRINTENKELKIILDKKDFTNEENIVNLALENMELLPPIYLFELPHGGFKVIKGDNIINSLIKYIRNKKIEERYIAYMESVMLECHIIRWANFKRIGDIKELINKVYKFNLQE